MKTLCIICMRKGSKEIKNKCIKNFNGKPLMSYTINQALKSKIFDLTIISTDSQKYLNCAKSYGAEGWFLRPKYLASDNASMMLTLKHALIEAEKYKKQKFDYVFNLHVTCPLRSVKDIRKAFEQFKKQKLDILYSVTNSKRNPYFNMVEKKKNKFDLVKKYKKKISSRQKAPRVYEMNASIYIWKRDIILKNKNLNNKKSSVYIMPEERSLDIDSKLDWKLAELLAKKNEKK